MLDTVVLTLDQREFEVLEPDRFSPSARGIVTPPYLALGARGVFTCFQNPTKTDFAEGRYGPRLTLRRRKTDSGFAMTLRIEFSAPKLIYGNNFDELRSRDFEAVLGTLLRSLTAAGIRATEETLRAARVSAIHYSKNILLTDFTSCSMVMAELERLDVDARLDLAKTDYRNGGHAIRYHANSHEIVVYDKLRDLEKARYSEKRAIETDNAIQFDLLGTRDQLPRGAEILRLEIRLGTRAKIKDVLRRIGSEAEPTFAALFDVSVARDVLGHFWTKVAGAAGLACLDSKERPEDILARVASEGRTHGPGKLLQLVGGLVLLDSVGVRGLSALMRRHATPRSWQRLKRELKSVPAGRSDSLSTLRQVGEALTDFKPISMTGCACNRIRPARMSGGRPSGPQPAVSGLSALPLCRAGDPPPPAAHEAHRVLGLDGGRGRRPPQKTK